MARRTAQMEVQLAHMAAQEARAAEAERAAAAERERMHAELLAAKSVDAMRQDAHAREVADMQARHAGRQGWGAGRGCQAQKRVGGGQRVAEQPVSHCRVPPPSIRTRVAPFSAPTPPCVPRRPPAAPQARITALQAEVTRAQEEADRQRGHRTDKLEEAARESRAARAEADVLRGQLEEARGSGAAAAARAEALGQQLAAAQAQLRVLEQQAQQREANVSCCGGVGPAPVVCRGGRHVEGPATLRWSARLAACSGPQRDGAKSHPTGRPASHACLPIPPPTPPRRRAPRPPAPTAAPSAACWSWSGPSRRRSTRWRA
jgi:hypothetical protein